MELHLDQQHLSGYRPILCRRMEERFSQDCVVPDSLPDAAALLLTEGDLCLWRLDLSEGSAELEGEISASLVCAPEGGGTPMCVPARVPVQSRLRAEEIAPGQRPVLRCRVRDLSGQLLNSRKLRVQGCLSWELTLYTPWDFAVPTGITEPPRGVFQRQERVNIPVISAVEEQVFTVGDTVPLRGGYPAEGRLLSTQSVPLLEESQIADGRLILRGRVCTTVLYQPAERGELVSEAVETPFSQLLDVDAAAEWSETEIHLTSAEVRCCTDDQAVETEFHLLAQCVCRSGGETALLTDAYSTRASLALRHEDVALPAARPENERLSIDGTIPMESSDQTVITARACFRGERVAVTVLLSDREGRVSARAGELALPCAADRLLALEPPAVTPGGEGLRVRLAASVSGEGTPPQSLRVITSAELGEGAAQAAASITLVRREGAGDLWALAKAHASSEAAIRAANPEQESPGRWLVIPRVI